MPNFLETGLSKADILRFVNFSRWRPPPSWLLNSQHFIGRRCLEVPDASLHQISFKSVVTLRRYCNFSNFQKMVAAAILYFWNFIILLAIWVERIETYQHAKNFVKIGESVAKILRFFDFSRWPPPPSWIVEFANFYWLTVFGVPRRITIPNFIKIVRSIGEILQFFKFSKWPPPPSGICEIAKFYWLLGWRGSRRICMPNFVKIGQSVAKILRFFDFKDGGRPPSWIRFGEVRSIRLWDTRKSIIKIK